jgi:CheY-like chemotaxis protein
VEVARAAQGESTTGLDTALDAVQQCAILTRQLLAFGRQQPIDTRTLDVAELLMQLRPLLERAVGPRIAVVVEGARGTAFVRADAGHLESLLVNLSVNARDAMPEGGTLSLGVELVDIGHERSADGLSPGRYARIRVSDTGTGISADVLPRIFDPYFSTKPMSRGNGLGLASVYGTVRQHGGNISVDTGDSGSTFWVLLPGTESVPQSDSKPTTQDTPKGLSVLVVDDLASVRELAAWYLRSQGLHVLTAAGGAEALEICQRHPVDVVVTDVQMPRMSGADLARELRALSAPPAIVFMTGFADRRDTVELTGVVVQKPFSGDDLRRAIQNATADSPRPDPAR